MKLACEGSEKRCLAKCMNMMARESVDFLRHPSL